MMVEGFGMWMHPTTDEPLLYAVIKEIETSSDRTAAIVAAAFVEDRLTTALRRRFRQDEEVLNEMFRETGGPLSAFGVKSNLAYLLGMFSGQAASDLKYMQKIRNKFAHNVEIDSFSIAPVNNWAMNLTLVDFYNVEIITGTLENGEPIKLSLINESNKPALKTPRGRFIITCQCLLSIFMLDEPPALVAPRI
jgi:hypothetical protein